MYGRTAEPKAPEKGKRNFRLLLISLAFVALFAAIAAGLSAADGSDAVVGDRITVDNIIYEVTSESPYTVAVAGYNPSITTATIRTTVREGETAYSVTAIDDAAFQNCSTLLNVTIPEGITSIGNSAFSGCTGLTTVKIPSTVTSVGNSAFSGCTGLASVQILRSSTVITGGDSMFEDGVNVILVPSARLDEYRAADKWSAYSEKFYTGNVDGGIFWNISDGVLSIGKFTTGIIPNYEADLKRAPWRDPSVTSATIMDGVTQIGTYAFYGISTMTSVTIPDGVTAIGTGAFQRSGLASVTIPDSVASIGNSAFRETALASVTIPDSVTYIGTSAFRETALASVTIPDVTSVDEAAFQRCTSLTDVSIQNSRVSKNEFNGCTNLSHVTLSDSVNYIGSYAFQGSGLASVTIPDSVNSISEYAFSNCINLASVTIPNSVTAIKANIFDGCSALISVYIGSEVRAISSNAFSGCSNIDTFTLAAGSGSVSAGSIGLVMKDKDGNAVSILQRDRIYKNDNADALVEMYVEFDANGGTPSARFATDSQGRLINVTPAAPSYAPHVFLRWNHSADGTGADWQQSDVFSDFTSIYAIYTQSITGAIQEIAPMTYKGSAWTPAPVATGGSGPTYWGGLTEGTDYSVSWQNNINAGTATVTVTGIGLFDSTVSQTFEITKIMLGYTGTLAAETKTYDGTTSLNKMSDVALDKTAVLTDAERQNISLTPGTVALDSPNAGTRHVIVSGYALAGTAAVNYDIVQPAAANVVVAKAPSVWTAEPADARCTYNGSAQDLITPGTASCGSIQYSLDDAVWSSDLPTGIHAGSVPVYCKIVGDGNHSDSEMTVTATIAKAASSWTELPAAVPNIVYSGSAQNLVTAGTTPDGNIRYSLDGTSYSAAIAAGTGAGTYTVYCKIIGDGDHLDSDAVTVSASIGRAEYDMSGVTMADGSRVYNGSVQMLTVTGTLPTGFDGIQVTVSYIGGATDVSEGPKAVTAAFGTASSNYNAPHQMQACVTITPRSISDAQINLESDTLEYNGSERVLNIQSVMCGTLSASYIVQGNSDKATDVGDYVLRISGAGNFTGECQTSWSIVYGIYDVVFDVRGHGIAPQSQSVIYGQKAAKPANPSEDGFNFYGWYREAACTDAYDFNSIVISDLTVYAKWSAVEKRSADKGSVAEFVFEIDVSKFQKVNVDGTELVKDTDYTVNASGSIDIRFTESFTESLSEGDHQVEVITSDGTAKSILEINAEKKSSNIVLFASIGAGVAALAAAGVVIFIRMRR